MGMFDNLKDIQVKCFPVSWWSDDLKSVYGIGGRLRYFKGGDKVPWITPWYNYGKDFLVFDYRFSDGPYFDGAVSVIRNGKFVDNYKMEDERLNDISFDLIIDDYGDVLRIKKPEDLVLICKESVEKENAFRNELDIMQQEIFRKYNIDDKKGLYASLKNIKDEDIVKDILKCQNEMLDTLNRKHRDPFNQKWYDAKKSEELDWMEDPGCAYIAMKEEPSQALENDLRDYFTSAGKDYDTEMKRFDEFIKQYNDVIWWDE